MNALNVEIKARCPNIESLREILSSRGAQFIGVDHQIDTYFKVSEGRLKLRQGNIENALIYYQRSNISGPKESAVSIYRLKDGKELGELLKNALGVTTIVDKKREIYYINNIKFHLDQVQGLGEFVEIEAIDKNGTYSKKELQEQCAYYMELFQITETDLIGSSYSDLIPTNHQL